MEANSKLKVRSTRNLKHKIAMAGLLSKDLATVVGVSTTHMSSIVNGNSNPSPSVARKIVDEINERLNENYQINDFFFDTSVKKNITLRLDKEAAT